VNFPLVVCGGFGSSLTSRSTGSSIYTFLGGSAEAVSAGSCSSSVDRGIDGPVSLGSAIPAPIQGYGMNGACLVPRSGGESLNSELPKVVVEVLAA